MKNSASNINSLNGLSNIVSTNNLASVLSQLNKTDVNYQIILGSVIDIIDSNKHSLYTEESDIGRLLVTILDSRSGSRSLLVSPISYDINYPYKGELVLLLYIYDSYYYIGILNIDNNVTNNLVSINNEKIVNKNYNKKVEIRPGDKVIYGRLINHIKFSDDSSIYISSGESGKINIQPNSVFKNETDVYKSIIWLNDNVDKKFVPCTANKSNYLKSTKSYTSQINNSILISSDKIILNSNINEVSIFSNKGIYLNSNGYFGLDVVKDVNITTNSNVNFQCEEFKTASKKVMLGSSATEPLVLGNKLVEILNELLDAIIKETHGTGTGPSTPPINNGDFIKIKTKLRTILSKSNTTI